MTDEMSQEQIMEQVRPLMESLGLDPATIFGNVEKVQGRIIVLERNIRICAHYIRSHDPEGYQKSVKVILDAEKEAGQN